MDHDKMWFYHDGATCHVVRTTINLLGKRFLGREIFRNSDDSPSHNPKFYTTKLQTTAKPKTKNPCVLSKTGLSDRKFFYKGSKCAR